MSFGVSLKSLLSLVSQKTICCKLAALSCESFIILTYHRILPKSEVTNLIEPGMYVTPSTLQKHIQFLKNYFEFVTIEQTENILIGKKSKVNSKPYCLISFDDGWLDFYQYAWPILEQEEVPAVVFLPTKLIGGPDRFWTDRLAFIVLNSSFNDVLDVLSNAGIKLSLSLYSKTQTKLAVLIQEFKNFEYSQIDSLLDQCVEKLGIMEPSDRTFMDWGEIRELYYSGLISFGSHTVNHAILTTLSKSDIHDELMLSKKKMIAEGIVRDKISFCYPNGNYTRDIASLVKEIGYSSAMSCDAGWNTLENDPFSLKRISLHQDISSTDSLLAYRLAQYL